MCECGCVCVRALMCVCVCVCVRALMCVCVYSMGVAAICLGFVMLVIFISETVFVLALKAAKVALNGAPRALSLQCLSRMCVCTYL